MRLPEIPKPDEVASAAAEARNAVLTKPPGALGDLEPLAIRLAAITDSVDRAAIIVAAGNHGVTAEGVSAYPSSVTTQMVANFEFGGAAINALAKNANADLLLVDAGVDPGTANFAQKTAMSRDDAEAVIQRGIDYVRNLDHEILCLGEMGIGNTTAAAAVLSVVLGIEPEKSTGRGTMVDDAGLQRKIDAVKRGIELHDPDSTDAVAILSAFGGFETGFLAGCILGAASRQIPLVLDGFPCTVAALLADLLDSNVRHYLFAAHQSAEPGHRLALAHLNLAPILNLQLRLGEGSGAALALPIIRAASAFLREMSSFEEANVDNRDS
ncbi:MAG: nicotinate-nucleotide--dimethylbenzimidazole phosphoribosyltransferase [Verrucomicrobiota bacterium]